MESDEDIIIDMALAVLDEPAETGPARRRVEGRLMADTTPTYRSLDEVNHLTIEELRAACAAQGFSIRIELIER